MALPILAGFALRGIGNLIKRRRNIQAMRGASLGRAINTQPQGPPTTPISQAATVDPSVVGTNQTRPLPGMSAGFDANVAAQNTQVDSGFGGGPTITSSGTGPSRDTDPAVLAARAKGEAQGQATLNTQGAAAKLGEESIARSRRRNKAQAALSTQALK